MPPILLTGRELAQQLDMRYDDVMRMARRGKIPAIRLGNGRYIFNLARVVEALRGRMKVGSEESVPSPAPVPPLRPSQAGRGPRLSAGG